MKEYTNIAHDNPKSGERCDRNLDKEPWGDGFMSMTCLKCGFAQIITIKTFEEWQYCDMVIK